MITQQTHLFLKWNHTLFINISINAFAIAYILLVNGAIPFLTLPTLGQAWWLSGFAQSMANEGVFSLYAKNFGLPEPAGIAFGLTGAKLQSILILFSLSSYDSYVLSICILLLGAYYGCKKFCYKNRIDQFRSSLLAALWLTLPIVVQHGGYSMLSIGIAYLPVYLYCLLCFLETQKNENNYYRSVIVLFLMSLFSVFTDGYTFVFFAFASAVFLVRGCVINYHRIWDWFSWHCLPTAFVFALAATSYKVYFGEASFDKWSMDYFRSFGLDVSFFLFPSSGVSWLFDTVGVSVSRSGNRNFGDYSVWMTTFGLPLLLVGIFIIRRCFRSNRSLSYSLVVILLLSFYLSLGPTFKYRTERPDGVSASAMISEYGSFETGSSVFSKNLPVFSDVRACYRWVSLSLCAIWMLIVIAVGYDRKRTPVKYVYPESICLILLMTVFTPNVIARTKHNIQNYRSFQLKEDDFVGELSKFISPSEMVVFLPYGNDFSVNYTIAKINARTFNIGGDKNLFKARKSWPDLLNEYRIWHIDNSFVERGLKLLIEEVVDVIILPHIDLLEGAHRWPVDSAYDSRVRKQAIIFQKANFVNVDIGTYVTSIRLKNSKKSSKLDNWRKVEEGIWDLDKYLFVDKFDFSKVGKKEKTTIRSNGETGYLVYGPYVKLEKGTYELNIIGTMASGSSFVIDIVSDLGRMKHYKKSVVKPHDEELLVSDIITLADDVSGLEVRVFVESNDVVELQYYFLEPTN